MTSACATHGAFATRESDFVANAVELPSGGVGVSTGLGDTVRGIRLGGSGWERLGVSKVREDHC